MSVQEEIAAYRKWCESAEGARMLQTANFCEPGMAQYLENRIALAFRAGVDAGIAIARDEAEQSLHKLLWGDK